MPEPVAGFALVPHLRATFGERVPSLDLPFVAGVALAPVGRALFDAARPRLGGASRLAPEDEAAGELARWLDGIAGELRPALDAAAADREGAARLLADGRDLAAGGADDDTAAAIEGYRTRAAEMAAAAERRPAPRRLRHAEALRRLDPSTAPLVGHPAVQAALARLDAATGALAGHTAALRQTRDELAGLAEAAARKRADRIAVLEGKLEKARRRPGIDRQRAADLARRLEALTRDLAALTADAGPARQGEVA